MLTRERGCDSSRGTQACTNRRVGIARAEIIASKKNISEWSFKYPLGAMTPGTDIRQAVCPTVDDRLGNYVTRTGQDVVEVS